MKKKINKTKLYSTLNNWVCRSFMTERVCGNIRSCILIYINCSHLLEDDVLMRLLKFFFDYDDAHTSFKTEEPLLSYHYIMMYERYNREIKD